MIAANCVVIVFAVSWLLSFQFIQVALVFLVGIPILLVLLFLGLLRAGWDLTMNPWIMKATFSRWNFFTTGHYTTWLLHRDEKLWLRQMVFFCLPLSISVGAFLFDTIAALASILLSVMLSPLLIGIEWKTQTHA